MPVNWLNREDEEDESAKGLLRAAKSGVPLSTADLSDSYVCIELSSGEIVSEG